MTRAVVPGRHGDIVEGGTVDQPLWRPSADRIAAANLTRFRIEVAERWGVSVEDFARLHRFSVPGQPRAGRAAY